MSENIVIGDFKIATAPFDLKSFIGKEWQEIIEERDERSAKLTEVDFAKTKFIYCLKEGESSIKGEEFLRRLKEKSNIRLGTTVFMGLWKDYETHKENSVIERLYQEGRIKNWLFFFGTILLAPGGRRRALYLYRNGDEWRWYVRWLWLDWSVEDLSAALPQV
jgi:hypothetical protein